VDGVSTAELRRLEGDVDTRTAARDTAARAVDRHRSQIAALRAEHADRTHRVELAAVMADIDATHAAWPAALAAWDAAYAAAETAWAEMRRLRHAEQAAFRRLERLDPEARPVLRVPDVAGGDFPLKGNIQENLHWTAETHWRGVAERKAAWEESQRRLKQAQEAMPRDTAGRVISGP
jgi:hypothetical protein